MNDHVHPLFRDILAAFADTAPLIDADRAAELQAEHIAECRADDREAHREELREREARHA